MALSIGILGPLVIENDDRRLETVSTEARSLFGYLAAQAGGGVGRKRLAGLLWPHAGSERARRNLHNCLVALRDALGPDAASHIVSGRAYCRVQDAVVDLDRFERLARSPYLSELQAAADLCRGEFLADFDLDSEPFQEWLAAERDRTLALICGVLHRLIAEQDAAGEHDAAIQSARRLVALDPLSELGQRILRRTYARAGRVTPSPGRAKPRWPCLSPNITVAVAPLRNLTDDPDQQNLVEALTDTLTTDLPRIGRGLSFARLSSERSALGNLAWAGEPEIGYVVAGSAQHSGPGKLRVNIRITDAAKAQYRWARRYEFRREELLSIRTKITRRISQELHVLLLEEASHRAVIGSGSGPGWLEASECLSHAANALTRKHDAEHTVEAQRWFLAALATERQNVEALTGLAQTCQHGVGQPWWGDPGTAAALFDLGREAIAIALELAPADGWAMRVQGMLHSEAGQLEPAARLFEQALAKDPRAASAHGWAGYNAAFLGRAGETLPAIQRAMRLDPTHWRHGIWYFFGGFAELLLGRTDVAVALLRKSLERNPGYGCAQLFLAAALSMTGRRSGAARVATSFRERYPEYPAHAFDHQWLSRSGSAIYCAQIHPVHENIRTLGMMH